jgi:hypothetical protein
MGCYRALYENKHYVLPSVSYTHYKVVASRLNKRYTHISTSQLYSIRITAVWLSEIGKLLTIYNVTIN